MKDQLVVTPIRRLVSDPVAAQEQTTTSTPNGARSAPTRHHHNVVRLRANHPPLPRPAYPSADPQPLLSSPAPNICDVEKRQPSRSSLPVSPVAVSVGSKRSRRATVSEEQVATPAHDLSLPTLSPTRATCSPNSSKSYFAALVPASGVLSKSKLDVITAPFEVHAFPQSPTSTEQLQNVRVFGADTSPPTPPTQSTFHMSPVAARTSESVAARLERIEAALGELMARQTDECSTRSALEQWARLQMRKEILEGRRLSLIEELQNCSSEKAAKKKLVAFLESSSEPAEYDIAIDSAGLYFKQQLHC